MVGRKSITKSPVRLSPTHKSYQPPALSQMKNTNSSVITGSGAKPYYAAPTVASVTAAPKNPDMPTILIEEFKMEPKNYGNPDALHDPDVFDACLKKWKELGILYVDDVIKNARDPIDYHLRVSNNDFGSAFGQVDRDGKMQGIGREVNDFIYEGQFKDNVYHGWGRFISHQGVYWGFWSNGLRNGQGKFVSSDGKTMEGNWVMGLLK